MKCFISVVAALAAVACATSAKATTIDFTAETQSAKPNGYAAAAGPDLQFTDTISTNLSVGDFGIQSIGNALLIGGDDASQLQMNFTFLPATALSLQFGNDDPGFTVAGDVAVLLGFKAGVQVTSSTVVLNRDDIMNQSIAISGNFDTAFFYYGTPGAVGTNPTPINLIEIVDNIDYTVPEPTSLATLAVGGAGLLRRRRQA